MFRKAILFLLLALSLITVGSRPVQAQEEMETVLARAAARSFLVTLTRPDLAETRNFYLLDQVKQTGLLVTLQEPAVETFEINSSGWVSDVTYQVQATLQPGDRPIVVYTGKYNGRWQVEGIDLPSDQIPESEPAESTPVSPAASESSGPVPVHGNGSGQLVFQTQSGGDIYLIQADGLGLRRITHGIDPQLSPDGQQIAFTRWQPRYELFTINVDGSNEQAWTHGWREMKSPTWTADGSSLIFSYQSGGRLEPEKRRINLIDAIREDDPVDIPSDAVGVEVENGVLKYVLPADAYWFLKRVDLNSGNLSDLATERHSYGPTGHPNMANLLIYKGQNGLALHNLETNLNQPVTKDFRDRTPVISPDGSQAAVSYWQDDHWEIHTMNLDGSNRQRLTSTPLTVLAENRPLIQEFVAGEERFVASENPAWNHAAPTWSPDGSKIAFITDRTGQWEIWIMNADGTDQRPMFPNGALEGITLSYAGVDERMLSWR